MEQALQGARSRCGAELHVTIKCPMNVDTNRVCRNGITKKFDPMAHESMDSLMCDMQWSMAQHLNAVHHMDWDEAQNMSNVAEMTTWADNSNEVESRPRSRSPPPIGSRAARGHSSHQGNPGMQARLRAMLPYMQVDTLPSGVLESIRASIDEELGRRS